MKVPKPQTISLRDRPTEARAAWFCPACQRHHAPHVETCPKPVDLIGQPLPIGPIYPLPVVFDPCAGCNGVCGNAFCPKRMRITCAAVPVADPSTTMWIS